MTALDVTVSALVRATWAAWAAGDSPNYLAVLQEHGITPPPVADPEFFGLLDSLELLGVAIDWSPDYVGLDVRVLSPQVQAELNELLA